MKKDIYAHEVKTKITEDKLFTGSIYKYAVICDVTKYIRNILHCADLKRATAVLNKSLYKEDCDLVDFKVKNDSINLDGTVVLEFNDGSVSRIIPTEDVFIEVN